MRAALLGQSMVHLPALAEDGWTDVVTVKDVHELLESYDIPPNLVDLAQDSEPLPKTRYTVNGALDRAAIADLHESGATIILRAAHRWLRGVRDLCARTEALFAASAQANIYLTPPSSQSTPPHWDTHDLFILQLAGSKNWRLFDSFYSFPLDDQRYEESAYGLGALRDEIVLNPGDALFLPRGGIHEPRALSYSAHVALGIHVPRACDLLTRMVYSVATANPQLRDAVIFPPSATDDESIEGIVAQLLSLVPLVANEPAARKAVDEYLSEFVGARTQPSSNRLSQAQAPSIHLDRVRLSATTYLALQRTADHVHVSWGGGQLTVPIAFSEVISAVASARPLVVSDVAEGNPAAAALIETLVIEGVLVSIP